MPSVDEESVNPIIGTFVNQMADAVDVLLEQVREQIENPQVEQIVGAPQVQRSDARVVADAPVHRRDPRADARGDREGARAQSLPGLEGGTDRARRLVITACRLCARQLSF